MSDTIFTTPAPRRGGLQAVATVLVVLGLAYAFGRHRLLSTSVDAAYHLQELELVRGTWLIPVSDQHWLSEIWWYPKLSHRAAALMTGLGFDDIDALTTLAVASAGAVWACLLAWARKAAGAAMAAGAVAALVVGAKLGAGTGAEVISNFFFPQLVAEGAAWLMLSALALWAWRRGPWLALGSAAAVGVCGCIHLLPTLNLAAALMALLVLHAGTHRDHRPTVAADLVGALAAPAAAVLNPFFGAMRWIAGNDGAISLTGTVSFPLLGAASALLAGFSASLLLARLLSSAPYAPGDRAAAVLAAMGAGVAGTALLQLGDFLVLHHGSAYAVRKHGFDVFTLLAFVAPLWAVRLAVRRGPAWLTAPAPGWAPAAGAGVALVVAFHLPSRVDVPAATRLMADVRRLRPTHDLHGVSTLFASDTTEPMLAYMADIAELQARHDDANVSDVITTGQPAHAAAVPHLVTRVGDVYDKPACREGAPVGGVVEVRGPCAAPAAAVFQAGSPDVAALGPGWSLPEHGVWSDGRLAVVDLPLPAGSARWRAGWFAADTFAFTPERSPRRTAALSVEGGPFERFTYTAADPRHTFLHAVPPAALRRGRVRLTFSIADPVSPRSLGLGDDPRSLGVGLERIVVLPDDRR